MGTAENSLYLVKLTVSFVLSQPQIAQPRANVHEPSQVRGDRNASFFNLPQNGGEGVMNRHELITGEGQLLALLGRKRLVSFTLLENRRP